MASPDILSQNISFLLDGQQVSAAAGESILQVAQRLGKDIPHLCYREGLRADGNCRACMVEVEGERVLAAACCRQPAQGMLVHTDSDRAKNARRSVLKLLQVDMPATAYTLHNEIYDWEIHDREFHGREFHGREFHGREFHDRGLGHGAAGLPGSRSLQQSIPESVDDLSHPGIAVHLQACIRCKRCLRACREVQVNDVIGYAGRGSEARIVFDFDDPLGESSCVGCGECVQVCPTGALVPATSYFMVEPEKEVASICPYCGVGCLLTYHIRDHKILYISGRNGPANDGRLCVKGRFGFDYVHNRQRLCKPLIRRAGVPKTTGLIDPAHPEAVFREASWDEALDLAATGLKVLLERDGADALAGLGSAKGSCEEAYLFQKLVRCGFHSNHVDHCTRLCHASSVAALLEGIGSGAVSNPMADVTKADVILITGANPTVNHPVGATWMKNAIKNGTRLILLDPRKTDLSRHARWHLQCNPASDVALINAMMQVIIEEDLINEKFINRHTEGFAALKTHLRDYSPAAMSPICGIDEQVIREVARAYATAKNAMILWGMGVSQHIHGTDNARCLIALCMITGQIGRPGAGLHPLRGQNNVQGASDVGLIPMVYPDYQRVDNPQARARFEQLWQSELNPNPGLTTVEIMNRAHDGRLKGLYIDGENPAMSDPVKYATELRAPRATNGRGGRLTFLRAFLSQPYRIGSPIPSSRHLAHALMGPFSRRERPAKVLEVGAGTGAITRHIGFEMGAGDELSICEMQPALASHIQRKVLAEPQFASAVREGRVTLAACAIQDFPLTSQYDYVISGLPLNAFSERDVREILDVMRRLLKPGGVFSYFEYVALRRLRKTASVGRARVQMRGVSSVLEDHIERFQFDRQIVLANIPPAYARHWRFE